jgi:hypothetical protein
MPLTSVAAARHNLCSQTACRPADQRGRYGTAARGNNLNAAAVDLSAEIGAVSADNFSAAAGDRRRIGSAARVDGEGPARLHSGCDVETETNFLAGERGPAIRSAMTDGQEAARTHSGRIGHAAGEHEHRAAADDGIACVGAPGGNLVEEFPLLTITRGEERVTSVPVAPSPETTN